MSKIEDERIDELEVAMMQSGKLVDIGEPDHVFSKGLYSRTIAMLAGDLVTSMVHKEEHQYVVLSGIALVKMGEEKWERIIAPSKGITPKGTRRVVAIEKDCIWMTIHATDIYPKDGSKEAFWEAVRLVEDQIFEKRENPLLGGFLKNNVLIKTIKSCQE
jgi:hypothetical protein